MKHSGIRRIDRIVFMDRRTVYVRPYILENIYFIYWIFYSALKTIACFWITKLNLWEDYRPVWWLSLPVTGLPSHVPFEPIEKCEMKFRLVSLNSRGTSINKSTRTFSPRNWCYLKGGVFIYFVVDTQSVLSVTSSDGTLAVLWKVKLCSCWLWFVLPFH